MNTVIPFSCLLLFSCGSAAFGQSVAKGPAEQAIIQVIDQYSDARDKQDTVLLKAILTEDIDQLVSTGEWRTGISAGMQGMLRSSNTNPGDRTIVVDRIRLLGKKTAIADARYDIAAAGAETRRMWSTFILLRRGKQWKIAGIRNMLPKGY